MQITLSADLKIAERNQLIVSSSAARPESTGAASSTHWPTVDVTSFHPLTNAHPKPAHEPAAGLLLAGGKAERRGGTWAVLVRNFVVTSVGFVVGFWGYTCVVLVYMCKCDRIQKFKVQ